MNHDQIRVAAPSVFATNPHPRVSAKYQFVPTNKVLETFEADGFECIHAKQQKVRSVDRKESTKHTLLLRSPAFQVTDHRGVNLPTVRLINSHDWSSTLQVHFGMLALVCSNGLYFAGNQFASYSIRHDTVLEDVANIIKRFQSSIAHMESLIGNWSNVQMEDDMRRAFAHDAAKLRFGEDVEGLDLISAMLLETRRRQDSASDLWTTFNVVQENVIKGGVKAGKRRSRAINNIEADRRLNEELFQLAIGYAG
jgi:hypothetical protein